MVEMKAEILVVDDDAAHVKMLQAVLTHEGYRVCTASHGKAAVEEINRRFFDLVLMDIRMQNMDGIEALKEIKKISPGIPVLLMTAYASVKTAVEALKSGAFDYLTKPLDTDVLVNTVGKALSFHRLEEENKNLKVALGALSPSGRIIGRSPAMQECLETLRLAAPSAATVLITGESGTGKELIAKALHENSPRKDHPLITVNCAALPETLLESELFGHVKGAFTGATDRKKGRFQLAHQGTIFLDEIAETSPAIQAKLLRVLQEKEFEPVGSGQTVRVDVRVAAATNRDLPSEIAAGRFREDLYYRLNVLQIHIPPLRRRKEDVPLLADFFLSRYAKKNRRRITGFSPRTMDLLMRYDWPGNVRELENIVERAVILSKGEVILPADLPDTFRKTDADAHARDPGGLGPGRPLKEVEKEMILQTLEMAGGNRTRAAEILGISRRTLQLKLKGYGVR